MSVNIETIASVTGGEVIAAARFSEKATKVLRDEGFSVINNPKIPSGRTATLTVGAFTVVLWLANSTEVELTVRLTKASDAIYTDRLPVGTVEDAAQLKRIHTAAHSIASAFNALASIR